MHRLGLFRAHDSSALEIYWEHINIGMMRVLNYLVIEISEAPVSIKDRAAFAQKTYPSKFPKPYPKP